MNMREDHVVETSQSLGSRRETSPPAVAVRSSLASTSFLYDVLTPERLRTLRNLPFEVAKVGLEPQLLRQYIPERGPFIRDLQAQMLGFLRENGFRPLVDLFRLSPHLGAAFAIPFVLTSLFGVLSFGMEAVLIAALGSFFALVAANDAARRLLPAMRGREDAASETSPEHATEHAPEPPRALPAPAPVALLGSGGGMRLDEAFFADRTTRARNGSRTDSGALLREGA